MENDESESNIPPTVNKGVNIQLINERPERDSTTSELDTDSFSRSPSKSLRKIKQDVQTIIDIMGPHTPQSSRCCSSNNDADNEESIYSNTRISCMAECAKIGIRCNDENDNTAPATDISLQEDPTDVSLVVEKSTTASATNTTDEQVLPRDYSKSRSRTREFSPTCAGYPDCICPPPLLPANVYVNPECMCPQIADYLYQKQGFLYDPCEETSVEPVPKCKKNILMDWIKTVINLSTSKDTKPNPRPNQNGEFYKMNMKRCGTDDHSPPRKFVFELVNEDASITKPKTSGIITSGKEKERSNVCTRETCKNENCFNVEQLIRVKTYEHPKREPSQKKINIVPKEDYSVECTINDKNEICRTESTIPPESCGFGETDRKKFVGHTTYYDNLDKTKVDVYYFDHGSSRYYKTTDRAPLIVTEDMAEKTQGGATKFWAEIFGGIHVGLAFITSFILQFVRFILYGIIRPLTIGLIQLVSDYFIKPFLATCFNAVVQPILIFIYNICTSLRDIFEPIAEGIGYFFRECAVLIGAFRLVEVKKECCNFDNTGCGKTEYRKQRFKR